MGVIRGVIFDVDGTLIDSNDAHTKAFVQAFAEHGIAVAYDTVRPLIGKGGDKLIPEVSGYDRDSGEYQAISERRKEIYLQDYVPQLHRTPGAKELLERLRSEGFQLAIATSGEEDVETALKHVGLEGFFEARASSKDAPRSKPDPDIVQAALTRLNLAPEKAILLGDTPYDLEAAHRANLDAIAFLTGGWRREDLKQAHTIYESPADMLAHFEQSPLFPR